MKNYNFKICDTTFNIQFNRHIIFVLTPNLVHNLTPNENNNVSCLLYISLMSPGSILHRSYDCMNYIIIEMQIPQLRLLPLIESISIRRKLLLKQHGVIGLMSIWRKLDAQSCSSIWANNRSPPETKSVESHHKGFNQQDHGQNYQV